MHTDLFINPELSIPFGELEFAASRSGGAGGQHVNKTNSRITLRWSIAQSQALNDIQRVLLLKRLAARLTHAGELIINVDSERSQHRNKIIAQDRLVMIVSDALIRNKKRVATKVRKGQKERRLKAKHLRGQKLKLRKTLDE